MGKPAKSQLDTIPHAFLPPDAKLALIHYKNTLRTGRAGQRFQNREDQLPTPSNGCDYFEWDVGAAHPEDDEPRGQRRLVFEVVEKSLEIREIYFTPGHYQKGTFLRVLTS